MKRIVEYTTQKGEVLKLTEISSLELFGDLKIYLPLNYRALYNKFMGGLSEISIDFTEDRIVKSFIKDIDYIDIFNLNPEFVDMQDIYIYAENYGYDEQMHKDDYDKMMKLASKSHLIRIMINNGEIYDIVYNAYVEGIYPIQSISLMDNDYPSKDYFTRRLNNDL